MQSFETVRVNYAVVVLVALVFPTTGWGIVAVTVTVYVLTSEVSVGLKRKFRLAPLKMLKEGVGL